MASVGVAPSVTFLSLTVLVSPLAHILSAGPRLASVALMLRIVRVSAGVASDLGGGPVIDFMIPIEILFSLVVPLADLVVGLPLL